MTPVQRGLTRRLPRPGARPHDHGHLGHRHAALAQPFRVNGGAARPTNQILSPLWARPVELHDVVGRAVEARE